MRETYSLSNKTLPASAELDVPVPIKCDPASIVSVRLCNQQTMILPEISTFKLRYKYKWKQCSRNLGVGIVRKVGVIVQ